MRKIAFLCLTLVLLLGAMGVSIAKWYDTISIDGKINTGIVNLKVTDLCGTWIYYDQNLEKEFRSDVELYDGKKLVSYAKAEFIEDAVTFKLHNLFPCIDYVTCAIIVSKSTIPLRISKLNFSITGDARGDWVTPLMNSGDIYITVKKYDAGGNEIGDVRYGTPLFSDESIKIDLHVHIPQDAIPPGGEEMLMTEWLMDRFASIKGTIEAAQWNEVLSSDGYDDGNSDGYDDGNGNGDGYDGAIPIINN